MRIQHNIMAMNAYRNFSKNTSALSKNLEKLSSGYKINRAGDDAAGLAISEKMRAQITGLQQAQSNAKSGINLIQTAEGAMQEVHDMLNRMVKLADQSANGTYDNDVDRTQLQKEVDQLRTEIDRIANASNFNGINLLDGSMEQKTVSMKETNVSVTALQDGKMAADGQKGIYSFDFSNTKVTNTSTGDATLTITFGGQAITMSVSTGVSLTGADIAKKIAEQFETGGKFATSMGGAQFDVNYDSKGMLTLTMKEVPTTNFSTDLSVKIGGTDFNNNQAEQISATIKQEAVVQGDRKYAQGEFLLTVDMLKDGGTLTIGKDTYTFAVGKDSAFKGGQNVVDLTDLTLDANGKINSADLKTVAARLSVAAEGNSMFKVGANNTNGMISITEKAGAYKDYNTQNLAGVSADATDDAIWTGVVKTGEVDTDKSTNGLTLQIGDTSADFNQLTVSIKDMHAASLGLGDIDISTQAGAAAAVDQIRAAINTVSDTRGTLGATQNRLDHTINNLSVMTENIQDAESTIRDTDVAEEMMAYTKNNILIQSAQAMLAQANQVPQGVLQLLQ